MKYKYKKHVILFLLFMLVVNSLLFPLSAFATGVIDSQNDLLSKYMVRHKDLSPLEESRLFMANITKSSELVVHTDPGCGIIGHGLKGIKAFGVICRVSGPALKWVLKPFSAAKAKTVYQNVGKIASACEKVNTATRGAVINMLVKLGVQKKTAEAITEIIFWII